MKSKCATENENLILIVEDEDASYFFLSVYLKKAGLNFERASSGFDAIEKCAFNQSISMVILDIRLHDLNGIWVCKTIKKMRPELKVIIETALSDQENKELAFNAGANGYYIKPLAYKELLDSIYSELNIFAESINSGDSKKVEQGKDHME